MIGMEEEAGKLKIMASMKSMIDLSSTRNQLASPRIIPVPASLSGERVPGFGWAGKL